MSESPTLIFPMAHYIGTTYNPKEETTHYDLRGGWDLVRLTQSERDVWAFAHGVPELIEKQVPWTREELAKAVRPTVGDQVDQLIASLLSKDILVEVTPGTPEAIDFAKEVRLIPLQLGLGNTVDEPWVWKIGPGTPVVGVTHTVYNTWAWGHLYRSLWGSCQSLAKLRQGRGDQALPQEDRDPEAILTAVLTAAHALLSSSCAYFDVPFDWGEE